MAEIAMADTVNESAPVQEPETAPNEEVAIQAAESAIAADQGPKDRFELSNGVVIKLKPVPILLLQQASQSVPRPKVPIVMNPNKDREEENPNHPDYLEAIRQYQADSERAILNTLLLLGTSVESVPDGFSGPDDSEWIERLEMLDEINPAAAQRLAPPANASKGRRYIAWLERHAMVTLDDFVKLGVTVGRLSGVREEDLLGAIDSFRYNGRGDTTTGDNGEPRAPDGD